MHSQIELVLRVMRQTVPAAVARLPSLHTLFLTEALGIALRPTHSAYTALNSFLLRRPAIDLRDVPLFYAMFGSGTTQYRGDRLWILRLLRNGLQVLVEDELQEQQRRCWFSYCSIGVRVLHCTGCARPSRNGSAPRVLHTGVICWIKAVRSLHQPLHSPGEQPVRLATNHMLCTSCKHLPLHACSDP